MSTWDDVLHFYLRIINNDVFNFSWKFYSYCFASQDSFCLVGLISCTFTVCLLIIATILLYYAIKTRRVRRELQSRSERSTVASRDMGDLARYFVDVGYVTAMRHSLPVQNEFKSTVRKTWWSFALTIEIQNTDKDVFKQLNVSNRIGEQSRQASIRKKRKRKRSMIEAKDRRRNSCPLSAQGLTAISNQFEQV